MPRSRSSRRCCGGREGQAVRRVLALPPAGADSHERPAAGQHVEGGGGLGGDAGRPERHRRDQRAQLEAGAEPGHRARGSPTARGSSAQARSTCGIWMRWSITDKPGEAGLVGGPRHAAQPGQRILAPREPAHLQHHLEPLRRSAASSADAGHGSRRDSARAAGSSARTVCTTSQPSSSSCGTSARCRLSWAASVGAGTGRSRAALRRRHSASGVSITHDHGGQPDLSGPGQPAPPPVLVGAEGVDDGGQPAAGAGGDHAFEQVEGVRRWRRGRAARCRPRRGGRRRRRSRRGGSGRPPTSTFPSRTGRPGRRAPGREVSHPDYGRTRSD